MKNSTKILTIMLLLCCFNLSHVFAQAPAWTWARTAGSTGTDYAGGGDYNSSTIATDAVGNSYVTGIFNGSATFGTVNISSPLHPDVFVAKYDSSGSCIWAKFFGGNDGDIYGNQGMGIDIDGAGNCYVTGTVHDQSAGTINFGTSVLTGTGARQIFIAKYDANGNEIWARQPTSTGGPNNYATSISTDLAGNSYITGNLGGGTNVFGGSSLSGPGAFVAKYDASGAAQWATKIGAGYANAICVDNDNNGNSFVSGFMQGTENFATNPVTTLTTQGMRDLFLVKIGPAGTLTFAKQFGGGSPAPPGPGSGPMAYCRGISIDGTGNLYLTGHFTDTLICGATTLTATSMGFSNELFIAKLDNNGNVMWAKQSNSSANSFGDTRGTSVKVNAAGDCFFTGYYYPSGGPGTLNFGEIIFPGLQNGNQILFVFKMSTAGNIAWGRFSAGGGSSSIPSGISIDAFDNAFVAGDDQGTQVFGTNTITSYGGQDVFVAKLGNATGTIPTNTVNAITEFGKEITLSIYPNPFSSSAIVNIKGYDGNGSMIINDISGREVKNINIVSTQNFILDREGLATGMYTYKLSGDNRIIKTGKLLVE